MTTLPTQEIFTVRVGDQIPLVLETFDGSASQYPQAVLTSDTGVPLGTVDLPHISGGVYSDYSFVMPNYVTIYAEFIVYSDAGHTIENTDYSRAVAEFTIDPNANTTVYTNPAWLSGPSLLTKSSGTVPFVQGALLDWFQPMVFTQIVKSVVNYQNVETPTNTSFLGVWQPFGPRQLMMKPEGQRSWKWFMVHAVPALELEPDEVITYQGVQYRVIEVYDYVIYGYMEYHLTNDYTGSGPN